jgi:hypothetical protein
MGRVLRFLGQRRFQEGVEPSASVPATPKENDSQPSGGEGEILEKIVQRSDRHIGVLDSNDPQSGILKLVVELLFSIAHPVMK